MSGPDRETGSLRYTDGRLLGEGASAFVSVAMDRWSGREVVLKEARLAGSQGHGFLKEARLLQQLRAPVFPELVEYDPGTAQRPARLIMERRPGRPLADLVGQTSRLDPADAAWIAIQVLQGLVELAEHGWIHGDLGPANLLLSGSRASLLDLGLARASEEREARRSGTFQVMPPEILDQGLPHPRSDMYSLGVLLYQLVTGTSPFPEDPEQALPLIMAGHPRDAGEAAGHPLLPLALRCMRTDPNRRPSPSEALAALLADLPPQRAALLLPRRGPGVWDPGQLDLVLQRLNQDGVVLLRSGQAGQWQVRLEQLALEASHDNPLLELRRDAGQSLLDWLALRVDGPGRLTQHPELARALTKRCCDAEVLRMALGFLDDQLERPRQGLCWVSQPDDPDSALLPGLIAMCARQRRPLVLLLLDGSPRPDQPEHLLDAVRLEAPRQELWKEWLRKPAPGIHLDDGAVAALDPLTGGNSEQIAPLVARCLSMGCLALQDGEWRLTGAPLHQASLHTTVDVAALPGGQRQALLRACAWLEPAANGAWRQLVWLGRERELEALEGAGLLRDRGDGQLVPRAGLAESLDDGAMRQTALELLHDLWRLPKPSHELGLLYLSRVVPGQADPEMASEILLGAKGLVDPARKIQLIGEWLPSLPELRHDDLESALASALVEQSRAPEACRLLKGLLRRNLGNVGSEEYEVAQRANVIKLAHAWGLCHRPRLAIRLLGRAMELSSGIGRLILGVETLAHLQREGRASQARAWLENAADELLEVDPGECAGNAHAINAAAAAAFFLGMLDLATRLWNHLSRSGRQALQVQHRVWLANNLGILHLRAGRLEQARAELEQAGREASLFHLDRYELMARVNLALTQLRRGAADQAIRELEPALVQARELQVPQTELAVMDHMGEAWAALGDIESAERVFEQELALAVELESPEDELDPLKHLLCLAYDLGLEPDPKHWTRFQELTKESASEAGRQWALLAAFSSSTRHRPAALPDETPAVLCILAAGRDQEPGEVLKCLLELDPRIDGVRLALNLLEGRLAWLSDWGPGLREVRESHRLHEVRLLGLEGELALRREDWTLAGTRLGRAIRMLEGMALDLSPAWQERLGASPWLQALLARAGECMNRLDDMERRTHGHAAGTVGRASGA